jgi:hypothetical protein
MQASGDLAPVLDLEVSGGLSPAPLAAWVHTYLSTVAALTGRSPILYTYPYFWASAMAGDRTFSQYPLWIASYSSSAPRPLGGWPAYAFWQYTDSGTISGIPTKVDVSVFNGTTDQLRAMALLPPLSAPSATPTPIPTPTPTPTPTPVPTPKATTPASATAPSPVGAWTGTTAWPGGVRLTGWVVDPAAVTGQASVRVSVDGRPALLQSAAANRPDLAAAHPLWGTRHGIDIALLGLSPGNHQICVTALSLSRATTSLLGCAAWAQKGDPKIGLSVTRSGTRIAAQGWAVDPQEKTPVTIEVRVAGQRLRTVVAAAASPVPTGLWSAWGPGHGFTISLSSRGKTNVCLTFVNQSYGSSRTVCQAR